MEPHPEIAGQVPNTVRMYTLYKSHFASILPVKHYSIEDQNKRHFQHIPYHFGPGCRFLHVLSYYGQVYFSYLTIALCYTLD